MTGNIVSAEIILPAEFILSAFAAAFAPTVLFCLYSEKITAVGSVFSIITGITVSAVLFYAGFGSGSCWTAVLPPAFAAASAVLFAVSLADKRRPTAKMINEFGRTREIMRMK